MKIELIDNTYLDLPQFFLGVILFLIFIQNLENYSSDSTRTNRKMFDLLIKVNNKLDNILNTLEKK